MNLNEDELLKEIHDKLNEISSEKEVFIDFRKLTSSELIDHIENTHHAYTKKVLPELGELTTKILRVHSMNHEVLFKVHKLFSSLKADLEQHL